MGYYIFSYDIKDSKKTSEDEVIRALINLIHPNSNRRFERGVATTFFFDSTQSLGQLEAKINSELGGVIFFYLAEIKTTTELFLKSQPDGSLIENFEELVAEEEKKRNNDVLDLLK